MRLPRASGVLLHPTSLPGHHGIGDLGPAAVQFVDWLAFAGQSLWQVLPLGPTAFGDSPYQCFSAFAGNPLLISLERLVEDGLLEPADLAGAERFPREGVDFGPLIGWKLDRLGRAARRLGARAGDALHAEFEAWRAREASWLDDYALFRALKDEQGGRAWTDWPAPLRDRQGAALEDARARLPAGVFAHRVQQWLFFRQWAALRSHAHARGVRLFGDAPIFVAHDSADVWARPELFDLLPDGRPRVVAGVPPDYFSASGQLWGNPLYRWDVLAAGGYTWWVERLRRLLALVDLVRLDHFIGFTRSWEVPGGATDARVGRFVPGPGAALFEALERALGPLPIVAEDLGVVTPEVEALRDRFAFPGMKVLHFAFGDGSANPFLPHAHAPDSVVYTGTHDNDTTVGWWAGAPENERDFARRYAGSAFAEPAWDLARLGMSSCARTFVLPAQDLLSLPTSARMNLPGRPAGNWGWRLREGALDGAVGARLRELSGLFGRLYPPAPG